MSNFVNLLDIVYPVGSIYHSMNATSPADSVGGTWTKIKTFLYGADSANQAGGEATHTLTVNEMPHHNHIPSSFNGSIPGSETWEYCFHVLNFDSGGGTQPSGRYGAIPIGANNNVVRFCSNKDAQAGGGAAHNNLPPYTTCFIWYRTA